MLYIVVGLGVLVLILAHTCHRLWRVKKEDNQTLQEQDAILSQVGELFDHIGVDLERSRHHLAAEDLKMLGSILRSRHHYTESSWNITWAQKSLVELGDRYGIEPVNGGPYCIRKLVRIAEEVIESVLKPR